MGFIFFVKPYTYPPFGPLLADDRSGVTFTAELCVPWDAPEAVIDINFIDLISLGSFPDKVGLFGRRKEAAVSRIIAGRDSRSVRFVVPDGRVVDRGYHDVTVMDMEEEREPMVVLSDMTRLRELWPVEVFDTLDLVQLWRCPIAWCTTWKGSPQDCLEHVRSGHDAPWVSKTASIEKYAPPRGRSVASYGQICYGSSIQAYQRICFCSARSACR